MIRKLCILVRTRAKAVIKAIKSLKAKCTTTYESTCASAYNAAIQSLARYLALTAPVRILVPAGEIVSESGNVLTVGKRYRLTSGHAPIFSLFTYFGNSR